MTKEQIYKKHVEQFFAKNRNCRFDDIPMSVFTDMMEEYANERLKNNSRLENVSGELLLNEDAKGKLEYINGHWIVREFPKIEKVDLQWIGAVLDLLEELKLDNYR